MRLCLCIGDVNLRDVRLKSDALDFLQLPITIHSGRVSELRISADWKRLGSVPVRVSLKGLYAAVRPRTDFSTLQESDIFNKALKTKLSRLKTVEEWKLSEDEGRTHQPCPH